MVISIQPSHSQTLVDTAVESFSYRWLVTMAALGLESPPSPHVDDASSEEDQHPAYFIDVDPKANQGGRGSVDDLEFEFLLPAPSRSSPAPADQIFSGGILLPFQRTQDLNEKDGSLAKQAVPSLDEVRALSRSLSADSWSSSGTMFSSCPSRASSASSSSCSSDAPLKPKNARLLTSPSPPPLSPGLSPLLPGLPKRKEAKKGPKRSGITLASIPQKIARLCLCLLAAACRRAAAAVSAANNGSGTAGSSRRRDNDAASSVGLRSRDNGKRKKGRKGVEGFSSAIHWCRADTDAAVENSIHEAVLHCKRSYARTD